MTEYALFSFKEGMMVLEEISPEITLDELKEVTEAEFVVSGKLGVQSEWPAFYTALRMRILARRNSIRNVGAEDPLRSAPIRAERENAKMKRIEIRSAAWIEKVRNNGGEFRLMVATIMPG